MVVLHDHVAAAASNVDIIKNRICNETLTKSGYFGLANHRRAKFGSRATWQRRAGRSWYARSHFTGRKQMVLRHGLASNKSHLMLMAVKLNLDLHL